MRSKKYSRDKLDEPRITQDAIAQEKSDDEGKPGAPVVPLKHVGPYRDRARDLSKKSSASKANVFTATFKFLHEEPPDPPPYKPDYLGNRLGYTISRDYSKNPYTQ